MAGRERESEERGKRGDDIQMSGAVHKVRIGNAATAQRLLQRLTCTVRCMYNMIFQVTASPCDLTLPEVLSTRIAGPEKSMDCTHNRA